MKIRDKKPSRQFFIHGRISSLRFWEKNRLLVVHKAMPFTAKGVWEKRGGKGGFFDIYKAGLTSCQASYQIVEGDRMSPESISLNLY